MDHASALLGILHDRLGTHVPTFCSKVDPLSKAFRHLASSITHQDSTVFTRMMSPPRCNELPSHKCPACTFGRPSCPQCRYQLPHDRTWGRPKRVREHVFTIIHFCSVLVRVHLLLRNAHALLEGNGILIASSLISRATRLLPPTPMTTSTSKVFFSPLCALPSSPS